MRPISTASSLGVRAGLDVFGEHLRDVAARHLGVAVTQLGEIVVAAEAHDLVEWNGFEKFVQSPAAHTGRDDVCPAEIHVDVGEHLGQHGQFGLVWIADVKQVELHLRIKHEEIGEMRGARVRDEVRSGVEAGVQLHGIVVRFGQPDYVMEHVVFEIAEGPLAQTPEALRQHAVALHDALEIARRVGFAHLAEMQFPVVRDGGLHRRHAHRDALREALLHGLLEAVEIGDAHAGEGLEFFHRAARRRRDEAIELTRRDEELRIQFHGRGVVVVVDDSAADAGALLEDPAIESRPVARGDALVDGGERGGGDLLHTVEILNGDAQRLTVARKPAVAPPRLEGAPARGGRCIPVVHHVLGGLGEAGTHHIAHQVVSGEREEVRRLRQTLPLERRVLVRVDDFERVEGGKQSVHQRAGWRRGAGRGRGRAQHRQSGKETSAVATHGSGSRVDCNTAARVALDTTSRDGSRAANPACRSVRKENWVRLVILFYGPKERCSWRADTYGGGGPHRGVKGPLGGRRRGWRRRVHFLDHAELDAIGEAESLNVLGNHQVEVRGGLIEEDREEDRLFGKRAVAEGVEKGALFAGDALGSP